MTAEIVIIREPAPVVSVATPGPQGPPSSWTPSMDDGNAITIGTDGGAYCPAVITATIHW